MRKTGLHILFFLLIAVPALHSQTAKRYSFTHYGSQEGLMSNEVTSVIQDDEGYMWIGTTNGLQRYDGIRFRTFRNRKNDSTTIPANYVTQLMIDKKRNLWVMTEDKIGIFDTKNFTYKAVHIDARNDIFFYAAKKLVQDDEGNIFIVAQNLELLTFHENRNEFSPDNFIRYPSDWKIIGLYNLPGTKKYIISTTSGITVYNRQTDQMNYPGHNPEKEGLVEKLGKIGTAAHFLLDDHDRLWFDMWDVSSAMIYLYDTRKNEIILNKYSLMPLVKGYHEPGGFLQQRNGNIWVKGLNIFGQFLEKEKTFRMVYNGYENEQSIAYSRVDDFFEDKEENIWVVTNNNGLYRFNPAAQFFTNIRQINRASGKPGDGSPMSFMQTKQNTILVGVWGDGLYQYDRNYTMLPLNIRGLNEKFTPSMWSMYPSKDGNIIWIGAQPGLYAFNQATRTATFHNPPILKEKTLRQIAEDKYGNLWIGTQNIGLFKWDAQKGRKNFDDGITQYEDVPAGQILEIYIDAKGYVWVGTSANGLFVIDPASNKIILHFGTKEPPERKLLSDGIASVLQYDDTTMIIAANGLHLYNNKQQRISLYIPLPESMPGSIAAVEKDKLGYLWVSTTAGIFRVNPQNRMFIHFDRLDGIANDHFILQASCTLSDGKILFGADNQFVAFDPMQVHMNEPAPDITITGFRLMNRLLKMDSLIRKNKVRLGPEDNSVAIEFSGLRYNGAYIIKYKLEGLDKDWIAADKNNQAIYSYLPPGTYTFKVQSADAEGSPGKNITSLVITVEPPFWKTWWFFCLLALLIAAVFYWLDKQRVNKLIALQGVRTEIASNLHEEVNTTLNNINLLSEMARIKADKDIELSKEFIDQISNKSHNMIIAMDDILWSIDPENDSMEKSLLRMMEFADALKNRHGANIELALDKKVRFLRLDMKTRHEVFLIFKEALRTIVQYSCGRETLVHIDLFKNKLSIKLQDATATLDKNVAEIDNSIREMNNRATIINADIDVQYDKKGVAIILLVPVK
ncbi:MAG: two-component regulator propeller domain-containing protein [Bacteroidota bacterium]|nr:two-component regulator propeller domain-containing protein [Bacteroidota bacterium]